MLELHFNLLLSHVGCNTFLYCHCAAVSTLHIRLFEINCFSPIYKIYWLRLPAYRSPNAGARMFSTGQDPTAAETSFDF